MVAKLSVTFELVINLPFFRENIPMVVVPDEILKNGVVLVVDSPMVIGVLLKRASPLTVNDSAVMPVSDITVSDTVILFPIMEMEPRVILFIVSSPKELILKLEPVIKVVVTPVEVLMPENVPSPAVVILYVSVGERREVTVLPPQEIPAKVAPVLVILNPVPCTEGVVIPMVLLTMPTNVPSPELLILNVLLADRMEVLVTDELHVKGDKMEVDAPVLEMTTVAPLPPMVKSVVVPSIKGLLMPASAVRSPPEKIRPGFPVPSDRVLMIDPNVEIPAVEYRRLVMDAPADIIYVVLMVDPIKVDPLTSI